MVIGEGFTGLIDELAIYDSDLSDWVVDLHYDLGSEGKDYCDISGAGGSSSTETGFNIRGCNFDFNGEEIGVSAGSCSNRPDVARGFFYCDEDRRGWNTTDWGVGCSMGMNYDTGDNGNFCCPVGQGYFCNESAPGSGVFKCEVRLDDCVDQKKEDDCNAYDMGCIWLGGDFVGSLLLKFLSLACLVLLVPLGLSYQFMSSKKIAKA